MRSESLGWWQVESVNSVPLQTKGSAVSCGASSTA